MRYNLKVKLFLCLVKHDTLETWGVEVLLLHAFSMVLIRQVHAPATSPAG
jgi:hypothetical protein